jgi:hypothetical protein
MIVYWSRRHALGAPRWCDTPSCMQCPLGRRWGAAKKILYGCAMYRWRPLESWMRMWCRALMSLAYSPMWWSMMVRDAQITSAHHQTARAHKWMIRLNEIVHKHVYFILLLQERMISLNVGESLNRFLRVVIKFCSTSSTGWCVCTWSRTGRHRCVAREYMVFSPHNRENMIVRKPVLLHMYVIRMLVKSLAKRKICT